MRRDWPVSRKRAGSSTVLSTFAIMSVMAKTITMETNRVPASRRLVTAMATTARGGGLSIIRYAD